MYYNGFEEESNEIVPMEVSEQGTTAGDQVMSSQFPELLSDLPLCAIDGCTRQVYCDLRLPEGMQEFQYCSPMCRDKMLENDKEKLGSDIQKMEQKLRKMKTNIPFSEGKKSTAVSKTAFEAKKPGDLSSMKTNIPFSEGKKSTVVSKTASKAKKPGDLSNKKQDRLVIVGKHPKEELGLSFSRILYSKDSIHGMIILSVHNNSPAYKSFQNDLLHLLDIVTAFDSHSISDTTWKDYKDLIMDRHSVILTVNQSIGLPPMAGIFAKAKDLEWTHTFALRRNDETDFGIKVMQDSTVGSFEKNSIGWMSGVIVGDVILHIMTDEDIQSAHGQPNLYKAAQRDKIEMTFKTAKEQHQNIILFVKRKL